MANTNDCNQRLKEYADRLRAVEMKVNKLIEALRDKEAIKVLHIEVTGKEKDGSLKFGKRQTFKSQE